MRKVGPVLHRLPDAAVESLRGDFLRAWPRQIEPARRALELYWPLYAEHGAADGLDRVEEGKHWMPEDHPDAIAAGLKDVLAAVS